MEKKKLVIALEQAPEELLATIHNHWSPYLTESVMCSGVEMGPLS
jgi:hypothetical protein